MLNTKEDILKNFDGDIICLINSILQNILFYDQEKKRIQVWNEMRVWWQNFHFWVNYPFDY